MADIDQLKKKVDEYYGEMKYKEIAECLESHKVCSETNLKFLNYFVVCIF